MSSDENATEVGNWTPPRTQLKSMRFVGGGMAGPGAKPIFDSPEKIWKLAVDYFEWNEANPLKQYQVIQYQGFGTLKEIPLMRAMTVSGLCLHIGMEISTFHDYAKKPLFSATMKQIHEIIRTQKFEGAAANLLNANIIARDLGLIERTTSTNVNSNMDLNIHLSKSQIADIAKLALEDAGYDISENE
jgi:hypothetical protein